MKKMTRALRAAMGFMALGSVAFADGLDGGFEDRSMKDAGSESAGRRRACSAVIVLALMA
jgi:hypothetical protein